MTDPRAQAPPTPARRARPLRTALAVAVVAVVAVAIALASPPVREALVHAARGDYGALRTQLRDAGPVGAALLYVLMLMHAVVPFPSEITNLAAGYVYGVWRGMALCLSGWVASAYLTYLIGRFAGRPVAQRIFSARALARAEDLVSRAGWRALVMARVLPVVPYSLVGYAAGIAGVRLWTFMWTTAVGTIPLMALMVVVGARAQEFRWSDPVLWGSVGTLLALLAASHPVARWMHRHHARHETGGGGPTGA